MSSLILIAVAVAAVAILTVVFKSTMYLTRYHPDKTRRFRSFLAVMTTMAMLTGVGIFTGLGFRDQLNNHKVVTVDYAMASSSQEIINRNSKGEAADECKTEYLADSAPPESNNFGSDPTAEIDRSADKAIDVLSKRLMLDPMLAAAIYEFRDAPSSSVPRLYDAVKGVPSKHDKMVNDCDERQRALESYLNHTDLSNVRLYDGGNVGYHSLGMITGSDPSVPPTVVQFNDLQALGLVLYLPWKNGKGADLLRIDCGFQPVIPKQPQASKNLFSGVQKVTPKAPTSGPVGNGHYMPIGGGEGKRKKKPEPTPEKPAPTPETSILTTVQTTTETPAPTTDTTVVTTTETTEETTTETTTETTETTTTETTTPTTTEPSEPSETTTPTTTEPTKPTKPSETTTPTTTEPTDSSTPPTTPDTTTPTTTEPSESTPPETTTPTTTPSKSLEPKDEEKSPEDQGNAPDNGNIVDADKEPSEEAESIEDMPDGTYTTAESPEPETIPRETEEGETEVIIPEPEGSDADNPVEGITENPFDVWMTSEDEIEAESAPIEDFSVNEPVEAIGDATAPAENITDESDDTPVQSLGNESYSDTSDHQSDVAVEEANPYQGEAIDSAPYVDEIPDAPVYEEPSAPAYEEPANPVYEEPVADVAPAAPAQVEPDYSDTTSYQEDLPSAPAEVEIDSGVGYVNDVPVVTDGEAMDEIALSSLSVPIKQNNAMIYLYGLLAAVFAGAIIVYRRTS